MRGKIIEHAQSRGGVEAGGDVVVEETIVLVGRCALRRVAGGGREAGGRTRRR